MNGTGAGDGQPGGAAGLSHPDEVVTALPTLEDAVVLLDFDGTLSDLVDDPGAAAPVPGAADAMAALADRTRVLVVSGRSIDDLRPRLPAGIDVTFAGGHGAELAHGDAPVQAMVDDVALVTHHRDQAIATLRDLLDDEPGWVVEVKPTGVAVHSRMVADPTTHMDTVLAILSDHEVGGMEVTHGHDVVELRPAGVHKGVAVARLLAGEQRTPVAFGDDVTDEDMFAEVVQHGGMAVVVAQSPRQTHAVHRLPDPAAVVATLTAWARAD
ncbi:MAG TPA: trehalose-phosphatase [Nitriliruptoraceae bacterium]|nr:trehalose-phosphatase [Nitriliruptoraceae bacterium]